MVKLGGFEEGLGGDAAPIPTSATGTVEIDHGDFFTKLGGTDGADISGWAAADDDEVVFHEV